MEIRLIPSTIGVDRVCFERARTHAVRCAVLLDQRREYASTALGLSGRERCEGARRMRDP